MKIDTQSLHYRLIYNTFGYRPRSLCSYFWLFWLAALWSIVKPVLRLIWRVVRLPLFSLAVSFPIWGIAWFYVLLPPITNLGEVFAFLLGVMTFVLLCGLWYGVFHDLVTDSVLTTESDTREWVSNNIPSLVPFFSGEVFTRLVEQRREKRGASLLQVLIGYLKAVKSRTCPLLEYEEEPDA